jgi:integrase
MITTSVIFDHRGRTKKNQLGPIEVRLTVDRRSYYINTGIKVLRTEFSHGEIIDRPDSPELNEQLSILHRAILAEVNRRIEAHLPIDVTDIRRAVWAPSAEQQRKDFLDWFASAIPNLSLAPGTLSHYRTTLMRVRACGFLNSFNDLTPENIYRFDAYLHSLLRPRSDAQTKAGIAPQQICQAAVYNHHKDLKAMIARAVRMDITDSNPYDRLKGQFKRGDRETVSYLTEDEVAAFESLHPVPGTIMAAARDLFVFQLYTGLAYSDTQRFSISDYKLLDGRWVNIGTRIKTGVPFVSQLLPPAIEVLERYSMQVPRLDNQTYNVCLKALGAAAGISTPLHSHIARHTFATFMLKNGVKIENLARMMGHTNITQTQRYAKVLAQSVHDDFAKIEALLKNKKGSDN